MTLNRFNFLKKKYLKSYKSTYDLKLNQKGFFFFLPQELSKGNLAKILCKQNMF